MPFLKDETIGDIQGVTIMINSNIDMRHRFTADGRIHICFSDLDKVAQDILVDFSDGSGLAVSDKVSHIDLLMDTDSEHLDQLLRALLRIRRNAKEKGIKSKQ